MKVKELLAILGIITIPAIIVAVLLVTGKPQPKNLKEIESNDSQSSSSYDASSSAKNSEAENKNVATESANQKQSSGSAITNGKNMEKYSAILKTSEGNITIELKDKETPKTVANFVKLGKTGFYNGTTFHRVIKDFMIQGGDPNGDGTGGPGYKFEDEPFTGEYVKGAVAMANSGPNTNGSQFFIMHADTPLPKNYTIFGKVVSGIEIVDKIAGAETTLGSDGASSKPVKPVKILSAEIIAR